MAGTNQFLPFATSDGANALTPANWQGASARQTGFQAGIAPSVACNTAWRQGTSVASMIGAFIAGQNFDALDNGDLDQLRQNFEAALLGYIENAIDFEGDVTNILNDYSITGGRLVFFTTNGTWTCPAGVTKVRLIGQAGGGAGGGGNGSAGAGGLGGNSFEGVFNVTPGTGYAVLIGAGGQGDPTSPGTSGGVTSFSSMATAKGGTGGGAGSANGGGISGAPPGLTGITFPNGGYELEGGAAQNGIPLAGVANIGGIGGGSRFSPSTPNPYTNGRFDAVGYGGGGSGGAGNDRGGHGKAGFLLIEY